jgi:Beta-propeller repeat
MSIISTTKRLPHGLVFPFIAATSLFAHSVNGADKPVQPQRPKLIAYARPLSFEPNRGQTRPRVDFLAHGIGYELFLSRADAVLVFTQRPIAKQISRRSGFSIPRSVDAAMVRMRPADGDRAAEVSGVQELPGKSNYFIGSASEKWRTNIPTYAKVLYRNVYPGVDLLDYGNQAQLEYDFVVSPGAEANAISLAFEGATKIDVDRSSELVMKTSAGEMRWHKPMAYQEIAGKRKLVACTYVQKEADRFGFALGSYDHAKPLIIDPVLEYSTYLGGTSDDQAEGIAVDEHGFAYVTGFTTSSDFPTSNPFQQGLRGQLNAFVSKFDIDGKSLIYFTYLGGSDLDEAESIAVDDFGYAYVTGLAFSADFFR